MMSGTQRTTLQCEEDQIILFQVLLQWKIPPDVPFSVTFGSFPSQVIIIIQDRIVELKSIVFMYWTIPAPEVIIRPKTQRGNSQDVYG